MDTVITIGDAGLIVIGIALAILIVYCILLVRSLIPAVKTLNRVLEDTERITSAAADGVEEAQGAVVAVSKSISALSASFKGNEGFIQGLTSLFRAFTAFIGLFRKKD